MLKPTLETNDILERIRNRKNTEVVEQVDENDLIVEVFNLDLSFNYVKFQITEDCKVVRLAGCPFYLNYILSDNNNDENLFRPPQMKYHPPPTTSLAADDISEYELILERSLESEDGCCSLLNLILRSEDALDKFKKCPKWHTTIHEMKNDSNKIISKVGNKLCQIK